MESKVRQKLGGFVLSLFIISLAGGILTSCSGKKYQCTSEYGSFFSNQVKANNTEEELQN